MSLKTPLVLQAIYAVIKKHKKVVSDSLRQKVLSKLQIFNPKQENNISGPWFRYEISNNIIIPISPILPCCKVCHCR